MRFSVIGTIVIGLCTTIANIPIVSLPLDAVRDIPIPLVKTNLTIFFIIKQSELLKIFHEGKEENWSEQEN